MKEINVTLIVPRTWKNPQQKSAAIRAALSLPKNAPKIRVKTVRADTENMVHNNEGLIISAADKKLKKTTTPPSAIIFVTSSGQNNRAFFNKNRAILFISANEEETVPGRKQNKFIRDTLVHLSMWYALLLGQDDNTIYWDRERGQIMLAFVHYTFPAPFWQKLAEKVFKKRTLLPLVERKKKKLINAMQKRGYPIVTTQEYRTCAEQNRLYALGRTRPGEIVTNAKCGQSFHNYRVAFDVAFLKNGKPSWSRRFPWKILGEEGKKLGLEWGGDWKSFYDPAHFQLTLGYSLEDFRYDRINLKKFL